MAPISTAAVQPAEQTPTHNNPPPAAAASAAPTAISTVAAMPEKKNPPTSKPEQRKNPQASNQPPAGAPYGVPAPAGGAGKVVVRDVEFPPLENTSLVGRSTKPLSTPPSSSGRGSSAGGIENKPPQDSRSVGHVAASAPAFVPMPRMVDETSFANGMIFKANNQTYGECLKRQVASCLFMRMCGAAACCIDC